MLTQQNSVPNRLLYWALRLTVGLILHENPIITDLGEYATWPLPSPRHGNQENKGCVLRRRRSWLPMIWSWISSHCLCLLCIRSKSLDINASRNQQVSIIGSHLRCCLPGVGQQKRSHLHPSVISPFFYALPEKSLRSLVCHEPSQVIVVWLWSSQGLINSMKFLLYSRHLLPFIRP